MTLDPDLSRKIQSTVRLRHQEWARRADDLPRGDPGTIGRVAGKLVRAYYRANFTGETATREMVGYCAGNLVYAMECYGLSFEHVCDLSEIRVAQVVSGLSPDITIPHGLRLQAAKSKLVEAPVISQIVRLAELYCAAKHVRDCYRPEDLRRHADILRDWAGDAELLFDGLNKLRTSKEEGIINVLKQTHDLILWVGRTGLDASRSPARSRVFEREEIETDDSDG